MVSINRLNGILYKPLQCRFLGAYSHNIVMKIDENINLRFAFFLLPFTNPLHRLVRFLGSSSTGTENSISTNYADKHKLRRLYFRSIKGMGHDEQGKQSSWME